MDGPTRQLRNLGLHEKAYQDRKVELEKLRPTLSPPQNFKVQNASKRYDFDVSIRSCGGDPYSPDTCSGPAQIRLYKKGRRPLSDD